MKHLLLCLLTSFALTAQDYPGDYFYLLKDRTVQVDTLDKRIRDEGYTGFYTKFNPNENLIITKKSLYPIKIMTSFGYETTNTDYEKLVGTIFTVKKTIDFDKDFAVFELYNDTIGTVYYNYHKKFEHSFCLKVFGGLEIPNYLFCEKLKTTTDKFTDKQHIDSPVDERISYHKIDDEYYLTVMVYNKSLEAGNKGAVLLLSDGSKISRPDVKIETDVYGSSSYRYSCMFKITKEELKRLSLFEITDYRLFIFDWSLSPYKRMEYNNYAKCLLND